MIGVLCIHIDLSSPSIRPVKCVAEMQQRTRHVARRSWVPCGIPQLPDGQKSSHRSFLARTISYTRGRPRHESPFAFAESGPNIGCVHKITHRVEQTSSCLLRDSYGENITHERIRDLENLRRYFMTFSKESILTEMSERPRPISTSPRTSKEKHTHFGSKTGVITSRACTRSH